MTTKCKGVFGFLFGHKMVDVYDDYDAPASDESVKHLVQSVAFQTELYPENTLRQLRATKSTYVRSYCERCGQQMERSSVPVGHAGKVITSEDLAICCQKCGKPPLGYSTKEQDCMCPDGPIMAKDCAKYNIE